MAFTVKDFEDLTQLLAERPAWQTELRHLILDENYLPLPQIVQALAESHERTETELRALAESQRRTDERFEELAESQRRTDEHVGELATEIRTLSAEVKALADAQRTQNVKFSDFQNVFGSTVEAEAESNIQALLQDKGYWLIEPSQTSVTVNGEIDVIMPFGTPTGGTAWVVIEAKARLGRREVRAWGQKMKSESWHKRLAARGVPGPYLVYAYAIRADAGAIEEAEKAGIGLATGRGERVAPKALIHSSDK